MTIQNILLACLGMLLLIPLSHAQPSSGSLLQEIESQQPGRFLPAVEPKVLPGTPPIDSTQTEQYFVKSFKFVGNVQISKSDLNLVLKDYVNRSLTFSQLQAATAAISETYRDRGWLVKAYLPSQDITEGTVAIHIIEARLGNVEIDNQSKRISDEQLNSWINQQITNNEPLSLNHLDRLLLLINDLPGISITGDLRAGKNPGETVLYVTVKDAPAITGQVSVDNFGDTATGIARTTANININGALGFNEQMSLYALYSEGSNYGRLSLAVPVGRDGLRLGINGSFMTYRVVNPAFTDLNASGKAQTAGLELSYPIIRSRQTNLYVLGNYVRSNFYNENIFGTASQYQTNVFQMGISGNRIDSFGHGGINTGSIMASLGRVNLNASPSQVYDEIGPQSEGGFTKLRYAFNRQQKLTPQLSLYIALSGQVSNKNLDVSEQIYMGGPFSVRAYALGQGAATQANLTTIELRTPLPEKFLLSVFYDYANIQTYKTTGFESSPVNNFYALQGLGLSLSWRGPLDMQIKATWARRTGSLPDTVQAYMNQNGGTSANRFWLTATLPF
jgi:hemolysin activation/secretion protein